MENSEKDKIDIKLGKKEKKRLIRIFKSTKNGVTRSISHSVIL